MCRVEELLATHQHALDRIASIYAFFQSFETAHAHDMRALADHPACVLLCCCCCVVRLRCLEG